MSAILRFATTLVLAGCLTAGCGGGGEQTPATEVPDANAAPATEATPAESRTEAGGCPPLGEPTESADLGETPLVFNFRHPEGFQVRKSENLGSMYMVELRKPVEIDGRDRDVVISIVQGVKAVANDIPFSVKGAAAIANNPAMKALAENLPKPAGEISFAGVTVPLFRIETEDKAVYHFNLPGDGGFYEVNVHFVPTHQSTACSDRLKELGEQWVQTLSPSSS